MNFSHNIAAPAQAQLPERQQGLSQVQSSKLEYLLSNYDAASLTDTDAIEIVENIRDIGIKSGRALGDFLAKSGFDAREIAEKAGLTQQKSTSQARPPLPIHDTNFSINSEAVEQLSTFIEGFDGDDITAKDWDAFFKDLDQQGIDLSKPFVDIKL